MIVVLIALSVLSITYFQRCNQTIQHKDGDSDFLKNVLNSFVEVQQGKIDPRTAACMINDLHSSSIKSLEDEIVGKTSDKVSAIKELEELKTTFESYRNALGETDLYKVTSIPVQITPSRPAEWKNTTNDRIAAVSKGLSAWLNKWAYVPGFGIVFCCETCDSPNYSLLILDEMAIGDVCEKKDVVLLGQRIIKEGEIASIIEMWNSGVDKK